MIDLATIPAGYNVYECRPCSGTGRKYDPTMADYIGSKDGSGLVEHSACRGTGVIAIKATLDHGRNAFAGQLLRGTPVTRAEPVIEEQEIGEMPDWMLEA